GAAAGAAAGVLVAVVLGRLAWCFGSAQAAASRRGALHDDALAVLGRPGHAADVTIIDADRPAVYCLPGRRRIVLTTGALARLDGGQLDAVLAHERAHLSGRHHLVLRLAAALERAFPGVRFFAAAARQIAYLVEVTADDAAIRRSPRLTLAAALLAVASAPSSAAESRSCSSRSPAPSPRLSRQQETRRPRTAPSGRRRSRAASPGGRFHRDELRLLPGAAASCQPP
nr:M56 family metallopeptidase [Actinomycetota bacterium]